MNAKLESLYVGTHVSHFQDSFFENPMGSYIIEICINAVLEP